MLENDHFEEGTSRGAGAVCGKEQKCAQRILLRRICLAQSRFWAKLALAKLLRRND